MLPSPGPLTASPQREGVGVVSRVSALTSSGPLTAHAPLLRQAIVKNGDSSPLASLRAAPAQMLFAHSHTARREASGTASTASQATLPPPKPDRPRAYRLAHAAGPRWKWDGVPLSQLKRLFPEKCVDTLGLRCTICSKKGHTEACCPMQASPISASDTFFHAIAGMKACESTDLKGPLESCFRSLSTSAQQLTASNPFRDRSGSLWSLRKNAAFWRAIGVPLRTISWIYAGFKLRFLSEPPMVGFENHPNSFKPANAAFIDAELEKRLTRGQISRVEEKAVCQIHPMEVVPKSSGGLRLIVDCRLLNLFLPDIAFKLENLSVVHSIVSKGDFMFSTDLEDAYYHIPIHESSRKHLCIRWRGVCYQYNVLPFGLSLAPWIFTKTLRPIIGFCRKLGIAVTAYLDDFLWADSDTASVAELAKFARALLSALGFAVSDSKSEWTPTQLIEFLGLLIDSSAYAFTVPKPKLVKIQTVAAQLRESALKRAKITARQVAVLCGLLLSVRIAVSPARIYTRALYAALNSAVSWSAALPPLSAEAIDELSFWVESLPNYNGKAVIRDPSAIVLHTDASEDGWGAHTRGASAFGRFPEHLRSPHTSSTMRELLAVLYALRSHPIATALAGLRVTFVLDSMAAVANLNKGGGPIAELSRTVKEIWRECLYLNIDANAEWIEREQNEEADALSRFNDNADWELSPQCFALIDELWGKHDFDRFASADNARCRLFNSRYYDPQAAGCDAFRFDWKGCNNYANPDWNDIDRTIEHARACRAQLTLIFPEWVSKPWFNTIRRDAVSIVSLPERADTLLPGPRSKALFAHPLWRVCAARFRFDLPASASASQKQQH